MSVQEPPVTTPLSNDQSLIPSLAWAVFFDQIFRGDAGEAWVPNFANLTAAGGVPKVTGRVYKLSLYLSIFVVSVIPPDGGSTSSTAGTTAITNFPLDMQADGFNVAVSGNLGSNPGSCDQASNNIYTPTWSAVTIPLTIIGVVPAS